MCSFVVTSGVVLQSLSAVKIARKNIDKDKALCIAEAGIDYGVSMLSINANYTGSTNPVSFGAGNFTNSVSGSGFSKTLSSTGTLPNGSTATVHVSLSLGSVTDGAIIANGAVITMFGNASTQTIPSTDHVANVFSNGNFSSNGNPVVDGSLGTAGSISAGGVTVMDPSHPQGVSGLPPVTFPTAAENATWQAQLLAQAQAGGTIQSSSFPAKPTLTVTGPKYINGNISFNQGTITMAGTGVIYVNGNIDLGAQAVILNQGVILACTGTVTMAGGSTYDIPSTGNATTAALVSFKKATEAISLVGGSQAITQGLVYTPFGGVKINGNGYITGSVIAGGEGVYGDVTMGGTSQVRYAKGFLKNNTAINFDPTLPGGKPIVSGWSDY